MKRIILSLAFFTIGLRMAAQQEYFVFIQEGAGQPFYVIMGEKSYSSSSGGHILIPSLKDSAYKLVIGFPKDRYPEQSFSIVMDREDRGFDLKQMPDGWALFDLRHLQLIRPVSGAQAGIAGAQGVKKTDSYSQLMAGLVNDSAVLYTPGVRTQGEPVQKAPSVREAPVKEPIVAGRTDIAPLSVDSLNKRAALSGGGAQPDLKEQPGLVTTQAGPAKAQPDQKTQAELMKTQSDIKEQPGLVTTQTGPVKAQTDQKTQAELTKTQSDIKVQSDIKEQPGLVTTQAGPVKAQSDLSAQTDRANAPPASLPPAVQTGAEANMPVPARKERHIVQAGSYTTSEWSQLIYIDRDDEVPDTIVVFIAVDPSVAEQAKGIDTAQAAEKPRLQVINSDCRNFAGGQDVDKLRVKILSEKEIYRKAMVARIAFKAKCYSVKQVRALSELFEDDAGRYQFLETAYPFVSDTYNFADMVDLFKTEYYIDRFKKLTGK